MGGAAIEIDRALYLPKAWTDDPPRLMAAHGSRSP